MQRLGGCNSGHDMSKGYGGHRGGQDMSKCMRGERARGSRISEPCECMRGLVVHDYMHIVNAVIVCMWPQASA